MNDVKLYYDAIMAKQAKYNEVWNYYLGNQPLVYANERLREVFKGVQVRFTENWCAVVVDSLKERMQLQGFQGGEQETLERLWTANQLNLESDDLHEAALVCGEAYLIIWRNEDNQTDIYYNDPRMCHMVYDSQRPRIPKSAGKLWVDEDGLHRLTLYYPDRLEYYRSTVKAENQSSAAAFVPDTEQYASGVAPNPYEQLPVFRFIGRRQGIGELDDITPIQNGINKLLTDMMVAAEYGAFRQRWVISNADVGTLKNAPNEIWNIPAGDGVGQATSVGEFSATDLANYLNAIETLARHIANISRTPKHYFINQGGDPSGEALIAMEAPLNRKAANRIERLSSAWQRAAAFMVLVDTGQVVAPQDIQPVWEQVETVQPYTEAQIRQINVSAGIPLVTALRREGWTEQELQQLSDDKEANAATFGQQLLTAFERGEGATS